MRLSTRLPLLVVGAVIVTGAANVAVGLFVGREAVRESAFAATRAGAAAYAEAIELYVASATRELEALASDASAAGYWPQPASGGADPDADARRAVAGVLEHTDVFESVALVRRDGTVRLVEPVTLEAGLTRPDVAFLGWFQELVDSSEPVVSDLHISTISHRPTVSIGVPVTGRDGLPIGYVVGGLQAASISAIGGSAVGDYFGYVVDGRGLIVAHGRNPRYALEQTDFSAIPAVREALAGRFGAIEDHNLIEREDRIAGFRPLEKFGWAVVYVVPTDVAFAPLEALVESIAALTIVLVAGIGIVALLVVRGSLRPLRRLAHAASEIAAGEPTDPLPSPGNDEVGLLAGEFGRMVGALAEREDDLRRHAEELEKSNRELESFSHSVAHDLRTPLRAIAGFSRRVMDRNAGVLDADSRRQLVLVQAAANQMSELIEDLLEYARLGRKDLDLRWLDPAPIVHEAFDLLAPERADRKVDLVVGTLPPLRSDRLLLRQVFVNLLSNAVKFAKSGPVRIEVGAEDVEGTTALYVRDDGIGFEMRYAERIFEVFERLNRAEDYPGTGVGLALVRRIVERHGGRVWAEASPGAGATFLFTLTEGAT